MENTVQLAEIAHARGGDKGADANIGVIAFTPEGFEHLQRELTADRVAEHFVDLGIGKVTRYELPRLGALNFVLEDALGGGASQSLRLDTQGKLLGTAILQILIPAPSNLAAMRRS